jgi:predicted metal-dependent hydrolase
MKKNDRITALVQQLGADPALALDPRYQSYFTCFNAQQYYEAHDVLENLWLERRDENYLFFKGLIQVAGAFVHLQKQFLHPSHPKHERRLRPAVRLFQLGVKNLAPFAPRYLQLDVAALCRMCEQRSAEIIAADYQDNPWHPSDAPQLRLLPA